MKANELRVLNYVLDIGDKLCQVMRVHANGVVGLSAVDGSYQWESFNLEDNVKPIPLIEKWLLEFGAEKYEFDNGNPNQYRIGTELYVIRDGVITDYGTSVKLPYVHTLQNLYFAKKGEELQIKEKVK